MHAVVELEHEAGPAPVAIRRRADGVDLEPVLTLGRRVVAEEVRLTTLVDDEHVHVAIPVVVGEGDALRVAFVVGARRRADVEVLLAAAVVHVELVGLRTDRVEAAVVEVPGREVEVFPSVEVQIVEVRPPRDR